MWICISSRSSRGQQRTGECVIKELWGYAYASLAERSTSLNWTVPRGMPRSIGDLAGRFSMYAQHVIFATFGD